MRGASPLISCDEQAGYVRRDASSHRLAMDKSQFMTIVITAVVSVMAKEMVSWSAALVKKIAMAQTTRAKLKAMFSKTSLRIMWDLLVIALYTTIVVSVGWTEGPLSGKALLTLAVLGLLEVVAIASFLADVHKALA